MPRSVQYVARSPEHPRGSARSRERGVWLGETRHWMPGCRSPPICFVFSIISIDKPIRWFAEANLIIHVSQSDSTAWGLPLTPWPRFAQHPCGPSSLPRRLPAQVRSKTLEMSGKASAWRMQCPCVVELLLSFQLDMDHIWLIRCVQSSVAYRTTTR